MNNMPYHSPDRSHLKTNEPHNRWVAFGAEISARRKSLGRYRGKLLTQGEIAQIIGITEKQLSRIETGVSGTEYETVVKLADALEYTGEERANFFRLSGFLEASRSISDMLETGGSFTVENGVATRKEDEYAALRQEIADVKAMLAHLMKRNENQ